MMKTPEFWSRKGWMSYALLPLSWGWKTISPWLFQRQSATSLPVPVICVGNVVMGGAGKTPTVLALVEILQEMGHTPHIISRGYGAYIKDSIKVDPSSHSYLQVGDEPLLLARVAPTWAGPDRILSAHKAIAAGATVLVMDDGLQNNSLKKTLSFVVVDALQGFGNEMVFPSGPLREPIETCAQKAQAMILVGEPESAAAASVLKKIHLRPFHAKLTPSPSFDDSKEKNVVAFCGMGCPSKFKKTLDEQGYHVSEFVIFSDHHPYTIPDMLHLIKLKNTHNARLITTAKDWLRLPQSYRGGTEILPVYLEFIDKKNLQKFIENHLSYDAKKTASSI